MNRVALFSITYHPFIGGAEIAIKEFTDRIQDAEFDLFTAKLDPSLPNKERIGNVNVYRLGSGRRLDKWLYPRRASRLAREMHKKNPYDFIHAIMATYAGLAALLFKKKVQSVPYILTLQSGDSDLFIWLRTWFWYPWYRQIYTRANHITAISNWLKERARKYGYKGEVSIVPNGVDLEYFSKKISAEHRISIRNIWDAKDSDTVVVTTSRLVHKNGVDILINAVRYLPESVKLVIAGTGEDEEKLLTLSREFHKRIKFIGHISHKKLPEILQSSDIFVRPSRSEGMGNSFIEAKAAGLPVLGTDVGGIKDLINDNIVDPIKENSEKAVAEKIKQIMDISENNQKGNDSLVKYSWNNITQKYEQVYKKLKK